MKCIAFLATGVKQDRKQTDNLPIKIRTALHGRLFWKSEAENQGLSDRSIVITNI